MFSIGELCCYFLFFQVCCARRCVAGPSVLGLPGVTASARGKTFVLLQGQKVEQYSLTIYECMSLTSLRETPLASQSKRPPDLGKKHTGRENHDLNI